MSDEIVNRVANSGLVNFDLEAYYPKGQRQLIDLKDWLFEGLILKEKDFRQAVKDYDWVQHQDQYCSNRLQCRCHSTGMGLYAHQ